MASASDQRGQATAEYAGLVLLVAFLGLALIAGIGPVAAGGAVVRTLAVSIVCTVAGRDCEQETAASALRSAYGPELAALLEGQSPRIAFEDREFASLPVDFRSCRSRECADSSAIGELSGSFAGEPATAFVHVVDCRDPEQAESGYDCSGERSGRLYLQYWLYYPDSQTEGTGPTEGYHLDDWESYQVRIDPDGTERARASSHHSYNGSHLGLANFLSDSGLVPREGWDEAVGNLRVAAGSHAGVTGTHSGSDERAVPAGATHLIPLEPIAAHGDRWSFGIVPPWLKDVWADPESATT